MWFSEVGNGLLIVAHTKKSPEAATWTAMCQSMRAILGHGGEVRTLVFTDGGGPTGAQREEMKVATQGKRHRVGVVSDAAAVRFIVSSMAFFVPSIQTFPPPKWRQGLAFLTSAAAEAQKVEQTLREIGRAPAFADFATVRSACASIQH
jgi:hypothetical protein